MILLMTEESPSVQNRTAASIVVTATYKVHKQIASAISWVCSAIRFAPQTDLMSSSTLITASETVNGANGISVQLNELEALPPVKACWHPLLRHTALAKGFPIRSRLEGRGLEISFADMALLSHSLSFIEYDGGLVVEGLRSILIPTELLPKDMALQWHFEEKHDQKPRRNNRVSDMLKPEKIPKRHKEQIPQRLIEMRCFLGWTEDATIDIGSKKYSNIIIRRSVAPLGKTARTVKRHSFTIGTSGLGFVTAEGNTALTKVSMPSRATFSSQSAIDDILSDRANDSILVYDSGSKTAWLLPILNVVLYMAHAIIERREYKLIDGDKLAFLQHTSPSAKSAREALAILNSSLDFKVRKPHSRVDTVLCPFSSTVEEIWHILDTVGNALFDAEDEFQVIGNVAPKYLHGIEFADVLQMNGCMRIKETLVDQPWAHLATYSSTVLFCNGLRQPVSPVRLEMLCDDYKVVPPGRNCLVATGLALKNLLEEHEDGEDGSRLNKRIDWIRQRTMVQSHIPGKHTSIFHEHELRSVDDSKLNKHLLDYFRIHENGAFIFVKEGTRRACSKTLNHPKVVSTPEIRRHIFSGEPPLGVPDSASNSSVETDFSSNANHQEHYSSSSGEYSNYAVQPEISGGRVENIEPAIPRILRRNSNSEGTVIEGSANKLHPPENGLLSSPNRLHKKGKMASLNDDICQISLTHQDYQTNSR